MPVKVSHNNDGHFYTIDVDLAKEGAEVFDLTTYFKGRVGDSGFGLRVRWFWQGQLYNTVGKKPHVEGVVGQYSFKKASNDVGRELVMSPDADPVSFTGDVNDCQADGYATYYFPQQMFPQDGMFKGTIGLLDDSGKTARYTSVDIWFKVYPNAGGAQMGKACDYYISELDKAIKEAEEDLKASKKTMQDVVDEFTTKMNDLTNRLTTQGNTDLAALDALEAKIKQDGLFTQAEADAFMGRFNAYYGVNVMDYGAVPDGTTDNADAIQKAYDAAKSKGINRIYFPSGRYFTTTTNLLIKNMVVSGQGPYESVLISDRAEPIFDVKTYGSVLDLGFEDTCDDPSIALAVQNTDSIPSYWGIRFERLHFKGREIINNQTGVWTYQPIKLDLENQGLWDITMDDINIEWAKTGVCVDMTNGGWLTGSIFNNITIKGFSEYAFGLVSSNNTARQCSQNVFSNLDAEVLYKTATNAVGYVVSGTGNDFDNLRLFNDGAYSGKAIQLRYFGGDKHDQKAPNFAYGATANNRFVGGSVEGTIDDPDGIRDLQKFDGLRLQIADENGNIEQVSVENPQATNLISNEELSRSLDYRSPIQIAKGAKVSSGFDNYGKYIEYTTADDDTYFGISLIRSDQVASVISHADRFSVGIKYREIDGTNPINLGTIRFNETEFDKQNLRYLFTNPDKGSLKQRTWIYNNDDNYWKNVIGSATRFDALWFYIGPNVRVRIYDAYLVPQQAVDFDKVSNRSIVQLDERGCRNYVKDSNQMLSTSKAVTNLAPQTIPFEVDIDGINWQTRRNITLSFDVDVSGLDCSNVISRLALYFEVEITFADQSVISYVNTGSKM